MYSTKRIVNQEVECQFHLRLPLRITWSSIDWSFIPSDLLFLIKEKGSVFMCRMRIENFRRVLCSTYIQHLLYSVRCYISASRFPSILYREKAIITWNFHSKYGRFRALISSSSMVPCTLKLQWFWFWDISASADWNMYFGLPWILRSL